MTAPAAEPVFFGPEDAQLFGWYHAPAAPARDLAVVLVPPLGYEYMSAYRTYRHLAERLARAGIGALRFDYFGTGDSAGDTDAPGLVGRWLADVGDALELARELTGAHEAALVGLRVGAVIAAHAAVRRGDVSAIVLWAPVASGRAFLREQRALHQMKATAPEPPAGTPVESASAGTELLGFWYSAETIEALSRLTLAGLERRPAPRVLLAERDDRLPDDAVAARLVELGAAVHRRPMAGALAATEGSIDAAVPEAALQELTAWLESGAAPTVALPEHARGASARRSVGPRSAADGVARGVREEAVRFGPEGRLFGIVSEPVERRRALPGILLPNTGRDHHTGPHRLFAPLAREWAALGFAVLRFDISGLGDSRPAPGHPENESYSRAAGADLAVAAEFLRSRSVPDVVAAGLCSGAHFGIFAALDRAPLAEVMAVNPQLYWRDGVEDRVDEAFQFSVLQQYGQSVRSWEKWRRLLVGRVSFARAGHAARGLGRLIRRRIERQLLRAPRTPGEQLADELRTLATSGPALFLVFSDRDGGFFYFNMHARPAVRQLERRRDFRLVLVEGADHNFMPIWCQRRLRTILTDRLRERYLQLP